MRMTESTTRALWGGLSLTLTAALALAGPVEHAAEREARFMQACMSDATVAAGQRQALCACVRDEFAYGDRTSFGLSDVLTLPEHVWEAPDRRLPGDSLGREVRRMRQACLRALARQAAGGQ